MRGSCECGLCAVRQKPTGVITPRAERLRGYEIELSHRELSRIGANCGDHLKKCEDVSTCPSLVVPDENCNCEICTAERGDEAVAKPVCPGHSCTADGLEKYLTDIVKASAEFHGVEGDFRRHRRTPRDNDFWDLKTDSSCGYEIATPPLEGDLVESVIGPVVKAFQKEEELHRAKFLSNACGLHVTFDVQDVGSRGIKQIVFTVLRHQAALVGTQPEYRRNNRACPYLRTGKGTRRELAKVKNLKRELPPEMGDRGLLNLTKVQHGSDLIEFRYGGASLDIKEIAAFGILNECVVQASLMRPEVCITNNRKRRLFEEIVKPYIKDVRVQEAWEGVLAPRLKTADLWRT